jgi:hypothetical protein
VPITIQLTPYSRDRPRTAAYLNPAQQTATPAVLRPPCSANARNAFLFAPSTHAHDSTAPAQSRRFGFRGQPDDTAAETLAIAAFDSLTCVCEEPEDTRRRPSFAGYTAVAGLLAPTPIARVHPPIAGFKTLCRLLRLALCWPAACAELLAPGNCARCNTEPDSHWRAYRTSTATTLAGLLRAQSEFDTRGFDTREGQYYGAPEPAQCLADCCPGRICPATGAQSPALYDDTRAERCRARRPRAADEPTTAAGAGCDLQDEWDDISEWKHGRQNGGDISSECSVSKESVELAGHRRLATACIAEASIDT